MPSFVCFFTFCLFFAISISFFVFFTTFSASHNFPPPHFTFANHPLCKLHSPPFLKLTHTILTARHSTQATPHNPLRSFPPLQLQSSSSHSNHQLGREEPAVSMDSSGKIIWARHSEVQQANIKSLLDQEIKDGEKLPLNIKDMGSCEIFPQTIAHNPNGRLLEDWVVMPGFGS